MTNTLEMHSVSIIMLNFHCLNSETIDLISLFRSDILLRMLSCSSRLAFKFKDLKSGANKSLRELRGL